MANISQSHFRFGKEELLEATHGWWQLEDVNHTQLIAADWTFLLRFCEQVTTAVSNVDAQFQYNKNGAGWVNITTTSSIVKAVASVAFTDAQACTKRLSGTGTFESSGAGCTEDGLSGGNANDIVLNGNSETEAGLQVVAADVANGDTIQFRLTSPDGTMVYLVTPTLTIEKAGATNYKTIAATAVGSPVLSRANSFYRTLTSTATGLAVLTRPATLYRSISVTAIGDALVDTVLIFSRTLTAVGLGIASLTKVTTYQQVISAVVTGVVDLTKIATHYLTIGATASGVVQIVKKVSKTLSATAIGSVVLNNVLTAKRTLGAVASATANVVTEYIAGGEVFEQAIIAIAQAVAAVKTRVAYLYPKIRGWFD